jgi:hypothetical protein
MARKVSFGTKLVLCSSPVAEATRTVDILREFVQEPDSINLSLQNLTSTSTATMNPSAALNLQTGSTQTLNTQNSGYSKLKRIMFSLQKWIREPEFLERFISLEGVGLLTQIIFMSTGNSLAYALTSLLNMMEGDKGWEQLDQDFINKVRVACLTMVCS